MSKNKCLFCRIVQGFIPSYKIYENKSYIAILDIYPNMKGQTLVISKRHVESYAFDLKDRELDDFIKTAKRVAKILEKKLRVGRVHLVLEGTGINHLHAKLYPTIGLKSHKFKMFEVKSDVYFRRYPGYTTTLMGPRASNRSLSRLQNEIIH